MEQEQERTYCNVCYEDIDPIRNQCITECGHKFCFRCIMTTISSNLVNNNRCPICRTEMLSYPDDEEDSYSNDRLIDEHTVAAYHANTNEMRHIAPISVIVNRILDEGFVMGDLVAMLLNRYERNGKYNRYYVDDSHRLFMDILNDEDIQCTQAELNLEAFEREDMAAEEVLSTKNENHTRYNKVFSSLYETIERSLMCNEELLATEYEYYSNKTINKLHASLDKSNV